MGIDGDDDGQVTGLAAFGRWLALPLEAKSRSCVDAGRNLDDEVFLPAVRALKRDRGLAAADSGEKGNGQVRFDRSAAAGTSGS